MDPIYKIKFMEIYSECMAQNFSSADARQFAAMVLAEKGIKP